VRKTVISACCLAAVFAVAADRPLPAQEAANAKAPLTITVRAVRAEVEAGQPVDLDVVMTNTSDHDVDCTRAPSNALDRNFAYIVTDAAGGTVRKIAKKYPEIGETFSSWPCVLKPGQSANAAGGRISNVYDFSRPGEYSIQVARFVAGDPRGTMVKSNTITVTVLPAKVAPQ